MYIMLWYFAGKFAFHFNQKLSFNLIKQDSKKLQTLHSMSKNWRNHKFDTLNYIISRPKRAKSPKMHKKNYPKGQNMIVRSVIQLHNLFTIILWSKNTRIRTNSSVLIHFVSLEPCWASGYAVIVYISID